MKKNLAKVTAMVFLVMSILSVMAMGTYAAEGDISVWTASAATGGTITPVEGGVKVEGGVALQWRKVTEEPVENPGTGVVVLPFALMAVAGAEGCTITKKNLK